MKLEPNNAIISNLVKNKSFSLKKFNRRIPNQNISRNLTYLDIMTLHQYIDSKRIVSDINIDELQKLYKKRGRHFITSAVSYFMKNYNYPPGLRPHIGYNVNIKAPMGFVPQDNTIFINEKSISDLSPEKCLVLIRHEFRHFEQFVNTLRCEKLSLEVVNFYAKYNMVEERLNELYKAHKLTKPNEKFDAIRTYMECIKYYEEHPDDETLQEKRKLFDKYRKIAINKFGRIMPDTEDSMRAEKIFAKYKAQALNPAGITKINFIEYYNSYEEYDAYLSQIVFKNQITKDKKCLFSELKKNNQKFLETCTSDTQLCTYLSKQLNKRHCSDDELLINFLHFD